MKKIIKKLIAYDKWYNKLKDNFLYQSYKKYRAKIAGFLNDYPSDGFFVIWVTGTNWKTTVVNLLHKILNDNLAPTVAISTASIKIRNKVVENNKKMTSLDCFDLQSELANAKAAGCKIAILETSSQWLDQFRFEWVHFDYAVLTNITQDHLDYHKNMDNYADAKKILFKYVLWNSKEKKYAAFCVDDKYGKKWFESMAFDEKISYSLNNSAVLKAIKIEECLEWTYFEFSYLWQKFSAITQLIGSYNVCNILWAISVAASLWLDMKCIINSVENFTWVPGRMDPVYINWIKFFVDFAHTPDWLEKTLNFASSRKWKWKLITVCGAPWNRDKEKRSIMWEIALQYSDVVIFTDDDPDTENRLKILDQLSSEIQKKWYPSNKKVYIIPEREYAIKFATEIVEVWDVAVFCWKWHEKVQLTNFWKREWNDKSKLIEMLENQWKVILNVNSMKRSYLEKIKNLKNQNCITSQQYYNWTVQLKQDSVLLQNQEKPQIRSGMFKPID